MVDHTAKIVPGRAKAHIPKIKTGQDLMIDPPHLLVQPEPVAFVTDLSVADEIAIAAAAPTLEAIGAPAADLSRPELETLATAPQDTAEDLHAIALAKTAGAMQVNHDALAALPEGASEPANVLKAEDAPVSEGVMGLGSSEAVA